MFNKWSGIIGGILAGWYFVKKWLDELSKIVEPLVREIEQMALDGKIDKAERKALVMKAIKILEERKIIKLNFLTRIIVGFVVDKIAQRLPDFKISKISNELLAEVKKQGI